MFRSVRWIRERLIWRIVLAVMVVICAVSAGYMIVEVSNAEKAATEAISSYGIRMSDSYARQIDTDRLGQFLKDPQENELYWSIRQELDRYRTQIGALYVYLARIDEKGQPLILIDGQPKDSDSASPINEVTDIPENAVKALQQGATASSPLIDNPKYGKYISTYAPVKRADGTVIAVLGIDTDAKVTESIAGSVIKGNMFLYALMLMLTLLGLGWIVFFVSRALRPLRQIVAGAERMAVGDLAEAKRLLSEHSVRSVDEIGAVYQAVSKMSNNMNEILGGIVSKVAHTSDRFAESTERFAREARHMLDLNTHVNELVQDVAEGAGAQQASTDEQARSMEEMTAAIQRISEASLTASDASAQALQDAEAGKSIVQGIHRQMRTIASATEEAIDRVSVLKGHSQEIGIALSSIADIAEQTKLLALNASIEAARAGEHGAGFAVVAGEVRKLADNAAGSAQAIGSLLQNIYLESQRIGISMDQGMKEIQSGTAQSGEADAFFAGILEGFRHIAGQIYDISASTEQISAGGEEVTAGMTGIADIARSSSDRSEQISELANEQLKTARDIADFAAELSGLTREMRESIRQIKV